MDDLQTWRAVWGVQPPPLTLQQQHDQGVADYNGALARAAELRRQADTLEQEARRHLLPAIASLRAGLAGALPQDWAWLEEESRWQRRLTIPV